MTDLSRRDFLKLLRSGFLYISGALALGGLLRFLDYEPNPAPQTEFDLGPASNFPLGSRTLLSDPPAVLLHTQSGFSALSLVCTHLGCTLEDQENGFTCPCHGSRFDAKGNVTHRPAEKPLQSLRVEVTDEGNLRLFTA
ncbi:MAG: Rieske (2Fe-2S) protein [Chloroflexi bacterium]|nr:Rieske (2Fe-2S) protein [Chloroflexota bacterium]